MKPSRGAAVAACLTVLLAVDTPASATPPTGVTATLTFDKTAGGARVAVRTITIAPGGDTGYHYHDGPLVAVVKAGTLTHYGADCRADHVYRAGDVVREPAGPHHVHIGRNEGRTPLALDVTYLLPAGAPFARDAPAPPCEGAVNARSDRTVGQRAVGHGPARVSRHPFGGWDTGEAGAEERDLVGREVQREA